MYNTDSWTPPSISAGRRRATAASTAPTASWDVPTNWQHPSDTAAPSWASSHAAGSYGSTGDPTLDTLRSAALGDASSAIQGARLSAQNAAPNDPSAAAYASLAAMLGGQSTAQHDLNQIGGQYTLQQKNMRDQQEWQEHILRLQQQLQEDAYRRMHANDWIGQIGSLAGTLGGAALA